MYYHLYVQGNCKHALKVLENWGLIQKFVNKIPMLTYGDLTKQSYNGVLFLSESLL